MRVCNIFYVDIDWAISNIFGYEKRDLGNLKQFDKIALSFRYFS